MKPIASGRSSSAAVARLLRGLVVARGVGLLHIGLDRRRGRLQLAGEAHDVDQRRAQVVGDDVGEALDLLVGAAEVGGALAHALLEAGIEGGDLALRRDELAGVEQHGPDRAADHQEDDQRAADR